MPGIECRGSKETIGSPLATVNAMSATFRVPTMTRDQFLNWAEAQGGRHEFDGFQPVAMTGGNLNHNQIAINILVALRGRLGGTGCRPHGMDAGVATIGDTVRYPDGVVTCSPANGLSRLVPDPVVVFEVISPTSGHMDRIVKLREYAAVDSIRRYVMVESASIGLTVHERQAAGQRWTVTSIMAGDLLSLPEIGIEIPAAELYEGVEFPTSDMGATLAE
ncbi:MAG: Uma2 family endonuclease [Acetobacteraceae bacterium]